MKKSILLLIAFLPIFVFAQTNLDTVYSGQVTSQASVVGFNLEGAEVSYTINDTVNNTFGLITFGITSINGEYMVDSLPVLKYSTALENQFSDNGKSVFITNNGSGPNHKIIISGIGDIPGKAYILDLRGQQVALLSLHRNSANKSFETIWNGEKSKNGLTCFMLKPQMGCLQKKSFI